MPKYKVGEILIRKKKADYDHSIGYPESEVLAISGKLTAIKYLSEVVWLEDYELDDFGYTLAQPARWVPGIGERYVFLDDSGFKGIVKWEDSNIDRFRLSIGNVFQVGDHEGIEALKRKLQEGGKSL